jgi:acyl-coenzyme A thioesterase PaaI-like protein
LISANIHPQDLPKWSPYSRTLNIEFLGVKGNRGSVSMQIGSSTFLAGTQLLDPRCIVGLIDHCMGYTLQGGIAELTPSATLNLRVDFESLAPISENLIARCHVRSRHSKAVLMTVDVETSSGTPIAFASAMFTQLKFPGGKSDFSTAKFTDFHPSPDVHSYEEAIGLQQSSGSWCLTGEHLGAVGWEPGNTYHGGALGSLLMATVNSALEAEPGSKRVVSFDITYLLGSSADQKIEARCTPIRLGKYASFYSAECFQGPDETCIARAEFCCLETEEKQYVRGAKNG